MSIRAVSSSATAYVLDWNAGIVDNKGTTYHASCLGEEGSDELVETMSLRSLLPSFIRHRATFAQMPELWATDAGDEATDEGDKAIGEGDKAIVDGEKTGRGF
jgi:hypothetical protein